MFCARRVEKSATKCLTQKQRSRHRQQSSVLLARLKGGLVSFNLQSYKRKKYRILIIGENSLVDSFLLFLETTEKFVFIAQGGEMLLNRHRIDAKKAIKVAESRPRSLFEKCEARHFPQRHTISNNESRSTSDEWQMKCEKKNLCGEREWSESNYPTISSRGDLCLPPLYALGKLLSGAFVNRVEAESRQQQLAA